MIAIDIIESLTILFDLLDRVDEPSHRKTLTDIVESALAIVPDYIAANPHKRLAVLAVLNRATGARLSTLDDVMAWYNTLPPAAQTPAQTPQMNPTVADVPVQHASPIETTAAAKEVRSEQRDPVDTVTLSSDTQSLIHKTKQWLQKSPKSKSTDPPVIPDADQKRQALLDKLDAMRD